MKHVELFSGIGGFRQGMRLLTQDGGPQFSCVGYSEIDAAAEKTYRSNFDTSNETVIGDIAAFVEDEQAVASLPRFDLLTGGFPCQSFYPCPGDDAFLHPCAEGGGHHHP